MTAESIKDTVIQVLGEIAPEVDVNDIDPTENIQDEMDIDSIDFSNFVLGLYEKTGIEIPERDYAKMASLDACVSYLAAKAA